RRFPVLKNTARNCRFCAICIHFKPDRAHHCSQCGTCLLKMDHHCPWIANCVGLHNQKLFLLTVLYTVQYCSFYMATTGPFITDYFQDQKYANHVAVTAGFSLAALLDCMVVYFTSTTVVII
ncbi:unnamed protein product, partial [Acanthoscelides obtectus]